MSGVEVSTGQRWKHRRSKRVAEVVYASTTKVSYRYEKALLGTARTSVMQRKPFVSTVWVDRDRFLKAFDKVGAS